jgi:hypothetical protein
VDPRAAVYEAVTMPSTRRHVIKALRKRNGRLDAIKAAALRALEQGVTDGLCIDAPTGRRDALVGVFSKLPWARSASTDRRAA